MARPDAVVLPDYYQKPFHAYKQGALCWTIGRWWCVLHVFGSSPPPHAGCVVLDHRSVVVCFTYVWELTTRLYVYALVHKTGNLCWDAAMEVEAGT